MKYKLKIDKVPGAQFRIFTSASGNGWWAVGVDFETYESACHVARALASEINAEWVEGNALP